MTLRTHVVRMPRGTSVLLPHCPVPSTSDLPEKDAAPSVALVLFERRHRLRTARSVLLRAAGVAAVLAAMAGTVAILAPAPAQAQFVVFDPSNYAENVLQAARTLEQISHQITSLQNEAQMLINQAKNLASLPTSLLSDIESSFAEMQNLLGQAERLAYDVQSIETTFQQSYSNFAASLSDQQLVETARDRWQNSVEAFEHSLKAGAVAVDNIEQTRVQTGRLIDASQSAIGVLQATQAGNQLLAVQSQQIAELTALLAAQGRADAIEQARQAAEYEQAQEQFSRFMTGTPYQPGTVRMFGN